MHYQQQYHHSLDIQKAREMYTRIGLPFHIGDTEGDDTLGDGTEGDDTEGDDTEGDGTEGDDTEGDGTEGDGTEGDGTEGDGTEGDDTEGPLFPLCSAAAAPSSPGELICFPNGMSPASPLCFVVASLPLCPSPDPYRCRHFRRLCCISVQGTFPAFHSCHCPPACANCCT